MQTAVMKNRGDGGKLFYELHAARVALEQNVSCHVCNLVFKPLKVESLQSRTSKWTGRFAIAPDKFFSIFLSYGFCIF